jgi:hypothetical protein
MTSVSYICVSYGKSRNFGVKARRAACAQLCARCPGPSFIIVDGREIAAVSSGP